MGKGKRLREARKQKIGRIGALDKFQVGDGDFVVTASGAKLYKDSSKHELLKIPHVKDASECGVVHTVLEVGMFGDGSGPAVTIQTENGPVIYRLPRELEDWARTMVGLALMGEKMFPDKVEFGYNESEKRYYAEFLLDG